MIKIKYLPFFFLVVLLFSCKSIPDDLIMFRDLNNGRDLAGTVINTENNEATILPGNVLRIIVSTGKMTDIKIYEQFNLLPLTSMDPTAPKATGEMGFQPYIVNEVGEIEFPILGKIKVKGLNHYELEDLLQEKLKNYLSAPIVRVNIARNWVKVFGEVGRPGLFTIENRSHFSILDALAEAGGVLASGDKKQIKLIREENGHLKSVVLDLTTSDIFSSPYYYVKQNDIIVVDPNAMRQKDAQYGVADNYKLSIISTIIGTVSLVASLIIVAVNNNNNK